MLLGGADVIGYRFGRCGTVRWRWLRGFCCFACSGLCESRCEDEACNEAAVQKIESWEEVGRVEGVEGQKGVLGVCVCVQKRVGGLLLDFLAVILCLF